MTRQLELNQLFDALARAARNQATVTVLIYGESGIDKTTLLHKFANAVSSNVTVAAASFTEPFKLALQPVADCVVQVIDAVSPTGTNISERITSLLVPGDVGGVDAILQLLGECP